MATTRAQWDALLNEIEQARNQRLENDAQVGVYFQHLRDISFDRARRGVDHLIRHYKGYSFPSVAAIREHCDKAVGEGTPNAISYSQNGKRKPWSQSEEAEYVLWRQTQIEHMAFPLVAPDEPDDEEATDAERAEARYWAYTYNTDGYRRRLDAHWREMWRRGAA